MIIDIFIIFALLAVTVGSYTDIKTLEVPDWLNYSLIAVGFGLSLIFTIYLSDISYILRSALGFAAAFIFGWAMYLTGQWGGGDSKMLFGLGAILGLSYPFKVDIFVKFILNMLVCGAIYGMVWIFTTGFINRKKVLPELKRSFNDRFKRFRTITAIVILFCILGVHFLPIDPYTKLILMGILIIFYFMQYLVVIVKAVEKVSMVRMIDISKLTEGDWVVDDVIVDGKKIASPKDLGVTKKQLNTLRELQKKGKIRKIKVKYGIPFVPSFFFGLVFTVITDSAILLQFIHIY